MDTNTQLEHAYEFFKQEEQENLRCLYRGLIIADSGSSFFYKVMYWGPYEDVAIKKSFFFGLKESTLPRPSYTNADRAYDPAQKADIFLCQKRGMWYYFTIGIWIEKNIEEHLANILDKVHSLDDDEFRQLKKEILTGGIFFPFRKLAFMDTAQKSGRKLQYGFKNVDEKYAYFYLHIDMPVNEEVSKKEEQAPNPFSLEYIEQLHQKVNYGNVLVSLSGLFTQKDIINLVSIYEGRIFSKTKGAKIIVEMLQNLFTHADQLDDKGGEDKAGIVFVSEKLNEQAKRQGLFICSGNYISNNKIDNIKANINFANNMSIEQCSDYLNKALANFDIENKPQLGFVDMRIKSEHPISYKIQPINNQYSFLSICCELNY